MPRRYCPPPPLQICHSFKKAKKKDSDSTPPPFLHDVILFAVFFFEGVPKCGISLFYFLKASPIHPSPSFSLKLSVPKTTQNCLKYMFLTSGHTGMLVLRGCCCNCTGGGQCQGRALRPATASLRSLTSLTLNTVDVRLWHSQPSSSYTLNVTCNMWSHSITLTLSIYLSNPVKETQYM